MSVSGFFMGKGKTRALKLRLGQVFKARLYPGNDLALC